MAKIAVSACLLGHCCKYNGGHNRNQAVLDFLEGCAEEALPVCPETAGGLPALVLRQRFNPTDG